MNLVAYDKVITINYRKTWIDPYYKKLYSFELPKYNFYTFVTKFNPECNKEELYIVFYNEEQENIKNYIPNEKHHIKKYRLNDVWKYFISFNIPSNVNLIVDSEQEDCVIYKFDI